MDIIKHNNIEDKITTMRDTLVILDSDVALIYGVETREINQAVKNNPRKFPNDSYIFDLNKEEWSNLKSKILISSWGGKRKLPTAFTEKGLYMLATILKGEKAEDTTIEIIETFAKIRDFSKTMNQIIEESDEQKQKSLLKRGGEIISDIVSDNLLEVTGVQTTVELNLAMFLKLKRTTTKEKRKS
jgi:hypothetical protein